jgi:hypothetical protein
MAVRNAQKQRQKQGFTLLTDIKIVENAVFPQPA